MKIIQILEAGFSIVKVNGKPVANTRVKTDYGVVELLVPEHATGKKEIISVPMDDHPDKYGILAVATVKITEEMVNSMLLSNVMAVERNGIIEKNNPRHGFPMGDIHTGFMDTSDKDMQRALQRHGERIRGM